MEQFKQFRITKGKEKLWKRSYHSFGIRIKATSPGDEKPKVPIRSVSNIIIINKYLSRNEVTRVKVEKKIIYLVTSVEIKGNFNIFHQKPSRCLHTFRRQ
jgi:hypothetical protein